MQSTPSHFPLIIYLIEDNPIDSFIVQQWLQINFPKALLVPFFSANEALEGLNRVFVEDLATAQVLLLDLEMPLVDGWDFLESYERSPFYKHKPVPVYIFTASINPKEVNRSKVYKSIAGFILKPLKKVHLSLLEEQITLQLKDN